MLWLSAGRSIDGLWVGSYFQENAETALPRVEAALRLIERYDRPRYDRLRRDLDRIWVRPLTTSVASFSAALRACQLDHRFVLAETTDTAILAAAIVHEATHARLWHCGIGYEEEHRHRVEAICLRRELAFGRRLPDGQRVREWAQACLAIPPSDFSDAAFRDRALEGDLQVLRDVKPRWLSRLLVTSYMRRAERRRLRQE